MPEQRTRGGEKRDKYVAFRWTPTEYDVINERAQQRDISLTEYVVKAALGELEDPQELVRRLDRLEDRMDALERLAELGSFG